MSESQHPVLKALKDRIAELERELEKYKNIP